jgi:hypothetical protein
MSLLSSFFEESLAQSDARSSMLPLPSEDQNGFGGTELEDIEELISALSSQASHSSHSHTYTQHP